MTLENLSAIGKLKPHNPTREEVQRLLASAEKTLRDAMLTGIGSTSRLDLAYKAIMQAGLAALHANGYRPSTSEPGHQQTTVQSLTKSIGLATERMVILDSFRRARNLADYEGVDVEDAKARECVEMAAELIRDVRGWIGLHRSDLA